MSLENLARIGSLLEQPSDRDEIDRRLTAARRSLDDAARSNNAPETRFDLAYKAIVQCAIAGLRSKGYRLSASKPGHHQTAIQTLPLTIGYPGDRIHVLDTMRRKRNGIDYEGDVVSESMVRSCYDAASDLLRATQIALAESPER